MSDKLYVIRTVEGLYVKHPAPDGKHGCTYDRKGAYRTRLRWEARAIRDTWDGETGKVFSRRPRKRVDTRVGLVAAALRLVIEAVGLLVANGPSRMYDSEIESLLRGAKGLTMPEFLAGRFVKTRDGSTLDAKERK